MMMLLMLSNGVVFATVLLQNVFAVENVHGLVVEWDKLA